MKIGIVGAGAMGSVFAYFFKSAGMEPVLLEKDAAAVASLKKGLRVLVNDEEILLHIPVEADPLILRDCPIVFLFVKSYSTEKAILEIKSSLGAEAVLVSLQNGLGNYDIISQHIPEERIVYGTTATGAAKLDAATVKLGGLGENMIGGMSEKAVHAVQNIFKTVKLPIAITSTPHEAVWKKAIINAGINPLGALLSVTNGEIVENEYAYTLQQKIVTEAVAVAQSLGVSVDLAAMLDTTAQICRKTSVNRCSMLQDISNNRKTEIESITGKIVEFGRQSSINTPFNETIFYLIKAKEG
ncbi:MAG: 2-dehydropantoate 2-reductase [bacterium]|nr:2-dehydropantoate 2-reductase [bacterium]